MMLTAAADAQPIQPPGAPPAGPYLDSASGMNFPAAVGDFHRFRLERGGPSNGISAGYSYIRPNARMALTIFMDRPPEAPNQCRAMADADRKIILSNHPGTIFADVAAPAFDGYTALGFSTRSQAPGLGGAAEIYYYCAKGWVIEYQFQHAAGLDAAALEGEFLHGLPPGLSENP
jgi:hypothetical protein